MFGTTSGRSRGLGLVELVVVVGILTILLGLLLPVVAKFRARAATTHCASNLGQIGQALLSYAAEQRGFVPRYGVYERQGSPNHPIWIVAIATRVGASKGWTWSDLPGIRTLQCPVHPIAGIPSGYVQNNFAFDSRPEWRGSPPVQVARVRNASHVPWVLEATDSFGPSIYGPYDAIFFEPYHSVRSPEQVQQRVHFGRHAGRRSNVLYFDGHVSQAGPGEISTDRFDDGIVTRF